jgi:hypothetical protein
LNAPKFERSRKSALARKCQRSGEEELLLVVFLFLYRSLSIVMRTYKSCQSHSLPSPSANVSIRPLKSINGMRESYKNACVKGM